MAQIHNGHRQQIPNARLGSAGWVALVILFGLLGWALWYSVSGWGTMGNVGISPTGWVFLVLGVVFTFAVGAGLMGLLFYSSRKGRDF
ncbi:MAG: hypothetical protein ABSD74_04130 [Rhizomicrobium sp.]|jgi:hypothetical protein